MVLGGHTMEKIASFTIDHDKMVPGIYVSRKDAIGAETITTFDIRMKLPNREPVLDNPPIHTIEHLGATFLRNHPSMKDQVIYFGPMGCRTGFYLLLKGDLESKDIVELITEMFTFIANFDAEIPGTVSKDCGNYLDHNLAVCKWEARKYLDDILLHLTEANLVYP